MYRRLNTILLLKNLIFSYIIFPYEYVGICICVWVLKQIISSNHLCNFSRMCVIIEGWIAKIVQYFNWACHQRTSNKYWLTQNMQSLKIENITLYRMRGAYRDNSEHPSNILLIGNNSYKDTRLLKTCTAS